MINSQLAQRGVQENWSECYASPFEQAQPAGTVDWARTEHDAHWRIWCADGTCRSVPDEIADLAGMHLKDIPSL